MKKHRIDKIQEISGASEKEITPEEDAQNRQRVVNLLQPIIEKTQNLPPVPVKESYSELLDQMRHGVRREPVIIDRYDGRKILITETGETVDVTDEKPPNAPAELTLHNSGGAENSGKNKFTDIELELLRKIENGE